MTAHILRGTWAVAVFASCVGPVRADFTLVALPDTQYYTDGVLGGSMAMFHAQTQWIVDNHVSQNIVFVLHEGDITDSNTDVPGSPQWQRANAAISRMDGIVPYILSIGNHDMGPNGSSANRDTTLYNQYFPASRFENEPWYGGRMPNDGNDNYYVYFSVEGMDFMIVSLEFGPNDAMLAWANSVVSANPTRRVIVLTHCYMNYDDTRVGATDAHNPHAYGIEFFDGGANDGEQMFTEFVSLHPNIFLVLSGHVFNPLNPQDGWGRLTSFGVRGNHEDQVVANYQMYGGGGSGFLRILHFIPEQDQIVVQTYSPYLDQSLTDNENSFTLFYDMVSTPPPPPTATLRLLRPDHCLQPGDTFPVSLWMLNLHLYQAAGYQAFLNYDPRKLALVSGSYTSAPFGTHLVSPITASGAEVDLASGVDVLQDQQPTSMDALLATLTFQALVPLTSPDITFETTHVPPTTLADTAGSAIPLELVNQLANRGDLNLDGRVNTLDLGILLSSWSLPATAPGCSGAHACLSDFNCDGKVNSLDLGILLTNWSL